MESMDPAAAKVVELRSRAREARRTREEVWKECWRIYRGAADWSNKEKWQARIFLPKAWNVVEQAVSLTGRYIAAAKEPWFIEPYDNADPAANARAEAMTRIIRILLDKSRFFEAFMEGLRIGFITGLGVWKVTWKLEPVSTLSTRAVNTGGLSLTEIVRTSGYDGRLDIRAIDPNNFYWLPGSRLNSWTGTIEDVEVPRWELATILPPELMARIPESRIDQSRKQEYDRFGIHPTTPAVPTVKMTEYYGPLFDESGNVTEPNGHIVIANDSVVILQERNPFWDGRPPYVGFSPIQYPLRVDGVGLIENIRDIIYNLNEVINLSVDSLLYTLLPVFEGYPEAYENPDALNGVLRPGTFLRRSQVLTTGPGIHKVEFGDVSGSSVTIASILDRAAQEGSLVSEILQSLPRYRGVQTATEVALKNESQNSFFGFLATQIEEYAIKPIVELALSRALQFLTTTTDPAIARALGLPSLANVTREQVFEMLQGPFNVRVGGVTEYIRKTEQLSNIMQFMTVIGQNAPNWLPYIKPQGLIRAVIEAFRPSIENIDSIIASPEEVAQQQQQQFDRQLVSMLPQLLAALTRGTGSSNAGGEQQA